MEEARLGVLPVGSGALDSHDPSVFDLQSQRYLLYKGNGYGRSGFGVAVWVDRE